MLPAGKKLEPVREAQSCEQLEIRFKDSRPIQDQNRHGSQRRRLLWYAWPQLFFNCTVAPVWQLERKERHSEVDCASSTNLPSNTHSNLPHSFGNRAGATADSSFGRGKWRRLYEPNLWMWHYGRGQPRRATVEEAEQRHWERLTEASKRAVLKSTALGGLLRTGILWEMNLEWREDVIVYTMV
jgi:hypothetical protein